MRHLGGPADRIGSLEPRGWGDVPRRPGGSLRLDPRPFGELLALLAYLHRENLPLDCLVTPYQMPFILHLWSGSPPANP